MNLETLKNNYAQEQGYEDWEQLVMISGLEEITKHIGEICILAQKAALENATENAKIKMEEYYVGEVADHIGLTASKHVVDRTSIQNPENLIR